jgi:hypothetical protein
VTTVGRAGAAGVWARSKVQCAIAIAIAIAIGIAIAACLWLRLAR